MSTYIRSREIVEMAIAVPYSNETRIVKANDSNLRNFASNLNYLKHLRLRMPFKHLSQFRNNADIPFDFTSS